MRIIDKKRDEIAALVREIKEDKVRSTHDPDPLGTNVFNVVHGWRGDELIVAIHPLGLALDTALTAAHVAAGGFCCDVLALTSETYVGGTKLSPLTGEPWAPDEMQQAVEDRGALEDGSVVEALMTSVVNRAGDVSGITERYRIDRHVNGLGIVSYDIEWLAKQEMRPREGPTVYALVQFMNEAPADARMARKGLIPADFDLTVSQARTHMDCAMVQALVASGFEGSVMLLSDPDDTERAEIIQKTLGGLAQEMP